MNNIEIELALRSYLLNPLRDWTKQEYINVFSSVDGFIDKNNIRHYSQSIENSNTSGLTNVITIETLSSTTQDYYTFINKFTESIEHRLILDFGLNAGKEQILRLGNDVNRFLVNTDNLPIIKPVQYDGEDIEDRNIYETSRIVDGQVVNFEDDIIVNDIQEPDIIKYGYEVKEFDTMTDTLSTMLSILYRDSSASFRVYTPDMGLTPATDLVARIGIDQNSNYVIIAGDEGDVTYFYPSIIDLISSRQQIIVERTSYIFIDADDPGQEVRNEIYITVKDFDFNSSRLRNINREKVTV